MYEELVKLKRDYENEFPVEKIVEKRYKTGVTRSFIPTISANDVKNSLTKTIVLKNIVNRKSLILIKAYLSKKRLMNSNTVCETAKHYKIYDVYIHKDDSVLNKLLTEGVYLYKLNPMLNKDGYLSLMFSGERITINPYYFDFLIEEGEKANIEKERMLRYINTEINNVNTTVSNDSKSKETKSTKEEKNEKEKKMKKSFGENVKYIANVNKDSLKTAAILKIGDTANKTAVAIVRDKLIPKKYRKATNNPFFDLVVANAIAIAAKQTGVGNEEKISQVTDAMITSSMIGIFNLIDINEIINNVMSSVGNEVGEIFKNNSEE